jgi:hypothetical protein
LLENHSYTKTKGALEIKILAMICVPLKWQAIGRELVSPQCVSVSVPQRGHTGIRRITVSIVVGALPFTKLESADVGRHNTCLCIVD